MAPKRKSQAGRKRIAAQKATEKGGRGNRDPKLIRDASKKPHKENPEPQEKSNERKSVKVIMIAQHSAHVVANVSIVEV